MSRKRIGIIGAGQLGRMTILAAKQLGYTFHVLAEGPEEPAAQVADCTVIGNLKDAKTVSDFVQSVDVATYEIESVNVDGLRDAQAKGGVVFPDPLVLDVVQDRFKQKQFFQVHGIPSAPFEASDNPEAQGPSHLPMVQKLRRGGYDGRGTLLIEMEGQVPLPGPSIFEEKADIEKELAVMVARDQQGQTFAYPVVEMVFNPKLHLLSHLQVPAKVPQEIHQKIENYGKQVVEALNGVGVFGLEFFLTTSGDVWINEIAPRPHNSGHYTQNACDISQFELFARILAGDPVIKPVLLQPAITKNLIASQKHPFGVTNVEALLMNRNMYLHLYGKSKSFPGRKMGHVNMTASSQSALEDKWQAAKEKIFGEKP